MKNLLVRITTASVVLLLASTAQAQYPQYSAPNVEGFHYGQQLFVFNWEISGPVGGFKDNYISDWSLRGFSLEGRRKIHPKVSVGGSVSWNRWDQTNLNASASLPYSQAGSNGVISGPVYRYADMFALRFLAHYYLMEGPIQPYVGVGIGGVWTYAYQQVVDLTAAQNGFYFIVDPEIGVLVRLLQQGTSSLNLNVAFRYTYTTSDVGRQGDTSTISPILGLAWAY